MITNFQPDAAITIDDQDFNLNGEEFIESFKSSDDYLKIMTNLQSINQLSEVGEYVSFIKFFIQSARKFGLRDRELAREFWLLFKDKQYNSYTLETALTKLKAYKKANNADPKYYLAVGVIFPGLNHDREESEA